MLTIGVITHIEQEIRNIQSRNKRKDSESRTDPLLGNKIVYSLPVGRAKGGMTYVVSKFI